MACALAQAANDAPSILQQKCAQCHGAPSGMSGLKVDSRENLIKGGSRGAALVPGKATESLLYKAVAHVGDLSMPPGGALPPEDVATIKSWIDSGAPWSAGTNTAAAAWWAFRKPVRPAVPAGDRNPVDAFIDRKLKAAGIPKSPEADRLTLLRRASYDLLGLPPSEEEIGLFLNDKSADAWEHVVDRLLASPRYGEKWGRHWLDLARYGDTAGFEQDPYILLAWRYRDYVIKSFNNDKPYDRFVKEQIAGDELYPADPDARTGTGFYRVGTNRDMLFKVEDINLVEKRIDMVDTTGSVFLGLTVGCARCHDHKFDPIPQRDYYRMQAIFQPATADRVFLDYNPARNYDIAENSRTFKLWQTSEEIQGIMRKYQSAARAKKLAALPELVQTAFSIPEDKRTPEQHDLAVQNEGKARVSPSEVRGLMDQADRERMDAIAQRLLQTFTNYGPPPMSLGIIDSGRDAPKTFIAIRGNPEAPGAEVEPGFLTALGGTDVPEAPMHATSTGRRKALAEFITSPDNPLFARVMVNRIWQFHFGSGLVKTPSDFGIRGGMPSHPELLDWLAQEFVDRKWSVKAMHRLIMTSDAYKRAANPTAIAHDKDPENDLLSHMNRRRLEAEEIRDASLDITGELNLKMGGVPVVPPLSREEMFGMIGGGGSWSVTADAAEHKRRTVYMIVKRTFQQPMAQSFDGPDGILSCPRRNESTTAPQSLELLNSGFTMDRAKALAEEVKTPEQAWLKVYGRKPSGEEQKTAEEFLTKQPMTELIRALMNTNEFLYVD
ncbi:MAG TPA: PSD1 and planctomycete cytochrome C domain-containing protein [Bryobacteraceae bacterium]|nr:PSD1 and planctomycete cytochrome C domain-containing protein [Bryobacteraceae bacterium]